MFFKKRKKKKKYTLQRLEKLNNLLISIAAHNYDLRYDVSDERDEFDALFTGITILAQELKQSTVSKDYLTSIYKGIVDMLIITNKDGLIRELNFQLEKSLLYKEANLIGKSLQAILDESSIHEFTKIQKDLEKEGFSYNIELTFVTKNFRKIPVSCSASLLYDRENSINGIMYIAKDISKIKETENQLRIKNREMDTFLYRSSHNLKGPIATILGLTQVMGKTIVDDESIQFLDGIQQTAQQLNKTLNRYAEFSRINRLEVKKEEINFEKIFSEIIKNWPTSEIHDIELKINTSDALIPFFSSQEIFSSIFQHMIDNSIKHRNKQTKVELSITVKKEEQPLGVSILVEDNGRGIPKEKWDKIFNMFERATEESRGPGLGLYLVKKCVDKLEGTIELENSTSRGTRFKLFIPTMIEETY